MTNELKVTLSVVAGPHQGRSFSFAQHSTFIVGRSPETHFSMPEKDRYFSRMHFLIEVNPPLCRLIDLGSHNGTFVRGQRVETIDLSHGDLIQAGETILQVTLERPAGGGPPTEAGPLTDSREPGGQEERLLLQVRNEQRQRWMSGERIAAEVFLERWPALAQNKDAALDLIYSEVILREQLGEVPRVEEYTGRFPALAADLRMLFEVHGGLGSMALSAQPRKTLTISPEQAPKERPERGPIGGFPAIPGFEILGELGRGGMGVVYKARRPADGTLVAIKTVLPAVKPTSTALRRFRREADILRRLRHRYIVTFRELGEAEGLLYFVMDFVAGTDAGRLLLREGPLPVGRAVRWTCQLLEALHFAHQLGYVHRDIKPGNLLITQVGGVEEVRLADFGQARTYQNSELSGLTLVGESGGTPLFMPPEQVLDFRSARPAADQFSTAATLYNLLTGQPIHAPVRNLQELLQQILALDLVPLRKHRPELPAELEAALHQALARKAEDRFPDVATFRLALLPFAEV